MNASHASPKDLIVLVADKNIEAAMRSILQRPESLGIRVVSYDIFVHPHHDPGCRLSAHTFLQPFTHSYGFATVLFDRAGCGDEQSPILDLESGCQSQLSQHGWDSRSSVTAIDPELEAWVWKESLHVSNAIGWENDVKGLYEWLRQQQYLGQGELSPLHPKEALEGALRQVKRPRSSAIYAELGRRLSLKNCSDASFVKLRTSLQGWFPEQGH